MHTKLTVLLITWLFASLSLSAQNRAPSLYLNYQDNEAGDIIINTLRVPSPSPLYTYYCGLLWNGGQDAGGYCGMQEHPNGRNFIYSLWDPITSSKAITADYTHPATEIANFGGEGTGLRSLNFGIGWETDQWYSLVSRAWTINQHTYFGYWVHDQQNQLWHHLVTMKYPVSGLKFNTRTSSFIEDWLGNGPEARTVHHQNGWKRKAADKSWIPFDESYFDRVYPDAGTVNYIENYDGGVIDNAYYFMTSGGTTMPTTNEDDVLLYLPTNATEPDFPTGEFANLLVEEENDSLIISWDVVDSLSPQYSYHIRIHENAELSTPPLLAVDEVKPHFRSGTLKFDHLINNLEYYIHFYTTDIFGRESTPVVIPFIKGATVSVDPQLLGGSVSLFPNPVIDTLNLIFSKQINNATIQIFDMGARLISQTTINNTKEVTIPVDAPSGLYLLKVTDGATERVFRFYKN